jgi:hypothetical protein
MVMTIEPSLMMGGDKILVREGTSSSPRTATAC